MDPNEITAGEYELVALQWDQPLSKPGEPFNFKRHRQGDKVTLDAEEARRLVLGGAVVKAGERERQAAEQARRAYEATLALLPAELRDQLAVPVAEPEPPTPPGEDQAPAERMVTGPTRGARR